MQDNFPPRPGEQPEQPHQISQPPPTELVKDWEKFFYAIYLPTLDLLTKWSANEDEAYDRQSELFLAIMRAAGALRPYYRQRGAQPTLEDLLVPGSAPQKEGDPPAEYSLLRLLGKNGRDVVGAIRSPFGEPVFEIRALILSDGTRIALEGEREVVYIHPSEKIPGLEPATLKRLFDEWLDT